MTGTVLDQVRESLPTITITRVMFRRLAVSRLDNFDPESNATEVSIGSQFTLTDTAAVYAFRLDAARADLQVEVEVEIGYASDRLDRWHSEEFRDVFGHRVALFAVYPFLRAKLHDLAISVEAPPPILDILVGLDPAVT